MKRTETKEKKSFWYCLASSLGLSLVFFILGYYMTLKFPGYTFVDTLAGTVFVLFLALIVSLSVIPPLLKKARKSEN